MLTSWTLCLLGLGVAGAFILKPDAVRLRDLFSLPWREIAGRLIWWRTWAAMFCASMAGKMFPDPMLWVLFDLSAAIIVIIPPRAGFQKVIAWLFAAMMLFELGWLLSERMNAGAVVSAGLICGWLQLAALLTWGIDERYGTARIRDWLIGPRVARHAVDGQ